MPILHSLVAVCDGCGVVQEFSAEVHHMGEPDHDPISGYRALAASDVEHDVRRLPPDWSWESQPYGGVHVLCPNCKSPEG